MSTGAIHQTLEQRVRQLLLLQETVKKVNSILDLEQLLDEIVGGVAEAFGCNRTAVLLKDDATNELEMIALRGFSDVHPCAQGRYRVARNFLIFNAFNFKQLRKAAPRS